MKVAVLLLVGSTGDLNSKISFSRAIYCFRAAYLRPARFVFNDVAKIRETDMAKAAQEVVSQNPYRRAASYFGDSLEELKKVQPPSRQETRLQTLVVLGLIAMFSAVLAVMDGLFNVVMSWIV